MTIARLSVELAPRNSSSQSLKLMLSSHDWQRISMQCMEAACHTCSLCDAPASDCRELWSYDDNSQIRTLCGLQALCSECYEVQLLNESYAKGLALDCLRQFMKVNQWELYRANDYISQVFETWAKRSQHSWSDNVQWLEKQGIFLKPTAEESRAV